MIAVIGGVVTIVLALLGVALKLTSGEVMESLDDLRRQEVVDLKRTLAQRMYRLAALVLLCFITFPFVADAVYDFDPEAIPMRLDLWMLVCLAAGWQVVGIVYCCICLSGALRDPRALSLRETFAMLFPTRLNH